MQQLTTEVNKEELKEFRHALRTGNTIPITSRYSDEEIVSILKKELQPDSNLSRQWIFIASLFCYLALIHLCLKFWPSAALVMLIFVTVLGVVIPFRAAKSESWKALGEKLRTANLPTLLDAYAIGVPELMDNLQESIGCKLSGTPDDVLEELTPLQRKQLVTFTLLEMQLLWSKPRGVCNKHAQAATLGYLALATLRQPGAERPDRRGIEAHHTNLSQAIKEYRLALETTNG